MPEMPLLGLLPVSAHLENAVEVMHLHLHLHLQQLLAASVISCLS